MSDLHPREKPSAVRALFTERRWRNDYRKRPRVEDLRTGARDYIGRRAGDMNVHVRPPRCLPVTR